MSDLDHLTAALAATQEHSAATREMIGELRALAHRQDRPARMETIVLTANQPVELSDSKETDRSIGVLNPESIPIYIGIAGGRADKSGRAPSVPPRSLLVLPLAVEDVELGVDPGDQPTLAGGDAVVFLLRFRSCQPAFLASI